jgi:hypothetical protein
MKAFSKGLIALVVVYLVKYQVCQPIGTFSTWFSPVSDIVFTSLIGSLLVNLLCAMLLGYHLIKLVSYLSRHGFISVSIQEKLESRITTKQPSKDHETNHSPGLAEPEKQTAENL